MARELHHRKKDNKYALYSTVCDGYLTEWTDKESIRDFWLDGLIEQAKKKVDEYMEQIDKEVDE